MIVKSTLMLVALLFVAVAALATWIGLRRQQSALATDIDRLIRAGAEHGTETAPGAPQLDHLPAPVVRYLRLAVGSAERIQEVRISQTGSVRTDATSERWMAFEAEHIIVPPATGFVWNARVLVAPLLHVRVRDALIEGVGSGQVSLLSAFTVSSASGGLEMNSGALHRYLAEAVWYPTALLPGPGLEWTPIDATKALATLSSRGVTVSLEFRFTDSGEVSGIYTPGRWGTFPGGYRQVPWEGHFRDYRERDGLRVPTEGDVGWYIDDEWRAVWNGTVTAYHVRTRE
jgi:hypothetical protein